MQPEREDELVDLEEEEEEREDELLDLEEERPPMEPPDAAIAVGAMATFAAAAASSRATATGISRAAASSWLAGGNFEAARLGGGVTGKRRLGARAGAAAWRRASRE